MLRYYMLHQSHATLLLHRTPFLLKSKTFNWGAKQ
jgi:hypothetical protein